MDFLVPQTDVQLQHRRSVLEKARHDPSVHAQVNSGRLSAPFPYRSSPLTSGSHPAAGLLVPEQLRPGARDGLQVVRHEDAMWVIRPDAYVAAVVTSSAEADSVLSQF
jgi:pentachlorophenol monooxygenase/3-(3-hydroxy-phenyl)propionate hydroxylase